MKINIYGVGRSGTTAIQLWLSYLMAQKYGSVWVNIEPLYWKERTLRGRSYRGRLLQERSPLLVDQAFSADDEFNKFFLDLANHNTVVTKFIRANGLINIIDKIMKPNLSVLIIRDVYKVLESISLMNFNMIENPRDWKRLSDKAQELYPFLVNLGCLEGNNKLTRCAVYWFVMNMFALENINNNTIVVDYDNLSKSIDLLSIYLKKNDFQNIPDISHPMFNAKNLLNGYYPLKDIKPPSLVNLNLLSQISTQASKILYYIYKFGHSYNENLAISLVSKILSKISNEDIGNLCCVHDIGIEKQNSKLNSNFIEIKTLVQKSDWLDDLSSRVRLSMDAILEKQKQKYVF